MKWREKSKRSEATLTTCMDDYGVNEHSNLSHSVRASNKEKKSKNNDTDWQQKRETTKTKDLQCTKTRALTSTTHFLKNVSSHFTHCLDFHSVLRVVNSICRCTTLFNFWLVREFLVQFHTANTGLLRCCLHTHRRLQQTAVSCRRSNCNKTENNQKKKKR